jgi:Fic family protein
MRKLATPPDFRKTIMEDPHVFERLQTLMASIELDERYLHWDKLRHLDPPVSYSSLDWWTAIKIGRLSMLKAIDLKDSRGSSFTFCAPDIVSKLLHEIDLGAGGKIGIPNEVLNPDTRDQYLVNSLMEEAITSSQLEGAATTRRIAKEMLRSGRKPRDTSERMIVNNYLTMRKIMTLRSESLSEKLVFDIHRSVTADTLEKQDAAGRYRFENEEITVSDHSGEIFHLPPSAAELPERMVAMCNFANGQTPRFFVHPVIRAILLHFWLAYDHPFVDGNGRTARALFYWSMLRQGYWLFEFISISDILRKAPAKYARAFLFTETDDNDVTYFIVHQVGVIHRAIIALHEYIGKKTEEIRQSEHMLRAWDHLNHRQVALLSHCMKHPGSVYSVEGHQNSHMTAYDTARRDLLGLVDAGLLEKGKRGKEMIFWPPADLRKRIESHNFTIAVSDDSKIG